MAPSCLINNGIVLHWAPFPKCIASTLLDLRPGRVDPQGIDDRDDVGLFVGKTFSGRTRRRPIATAGPMSRLGNYILTAKAYDTSNVSATSSAVTVTVNGGTSNPCAGLCSSPTVFTTARYQSGSLGTGAVCRETQANLTGGNCSEMHGRTLKVNGTAMNCIGWTLPFKRNGGYCVQVTAGTPDWASFATW